jgi:hypothetical protein
MDEAALCHWSAVGDPWCVEYWESECGQVFTFIEDGPRDNGFEFCPYCGKSLVELPVTDDEEE